MLTPRHQMRIRTQRMRLLDEQAQRTHHLALFGSRSKLRATDPRFQLLADQLPQLILLVSPHADSVLAANAHAEEFFGRTREELCTAPLSSLLAENASPLVRDLKGLAPGATLLFENSLWKGKAATLAVADLQATCIEIDDQLLVMLMGASAPVVPAPAPAKSPTPTQTLEPDRKSVV